MHFEGWKMGVSSKIKAEDLKLTESTIFLTMAFKLSLRDNMLPQLCAWFQRINTLIQLICQ